jgi:hypothetical protein
MAVVLSIVCLSMQIGEASSDGLVVAREYNLWITNSNGEHSFVTFPLFVVLLLSSALGFCSIFLYRNRMLQARICIFNMLLLVGWYVLFAVYAQVVGYSESQSAFAVLLPASFPAVAVILYFMARKSIIKDEKLVRAADRIR